MGITGIKENYMTFQITSDGKVLLVPKYTTQPTSESTQAPLEELGKEGAKFLEKCLREKLGITTDPPKGK